MRPSLILTLLFALGGVCAGAIALAEDTVRPQKETGKPPVDARTVMAGKQAFQDVYNVLLSPRCMNCHPDGDRPLQTDRSTPHAMNISHQGTEAGLECATCHQTKNSEAMGIAGGPPGAPNWHLPERDMPLIFQNRTPNQLCKQLKDPKQNGHKTLDQLLHHVSHDPLVLWGWNPGGNRTKPPLSHEAFVKSFTVWVNSGGACPNP